MHSSQDLIQYLLSDEDALNGSHIPSRESSQLAKIIEGMPGGFLIYRADGDEEILYANTALLRIFNCTTMEEFRDLTGNSFRGVVHPEDLEAVEKSIQEQIAHSQYDLDYVEYRIIQKGGEIRWIEDYGHYVHTGRGNVFYVFLGDATEKRHRHMSLLEGLTQEQFRHLDVIHGLSLNYESIFYADLDNNTIQTYRTSSRIEYQFSGEHRQRPFDGFADEYIETWVHPEDRALVTDALAPDRIRARLSQEKLFSLTYRILWNGDVQYLQLYIVNIGRPDRPAQVVLGVRSVDKEFRSNLRRREALESALQRAKVAIAAKDTFLSNMSHDMRTPMNAILGFTALAGKHLADAEKLRSDLASIEAAGMQMLRLIDDVLELTRIQSDQYPLQSGLCDLGEAMESVRTAVLPRASAKGLELSLDLTGLTRPAVYTDRDKLVGILLQLTDNAVKYTPAGGQVSLSAVRIAGTDSRQSRYHFTVADTGSGISPSFMQHLFQPFEREKNTTQSGQSGTGLGLTIAKSLADMLGGTIRAESSPGLGSRFTLELTLPAADGAEEECRDTLSSAQPGSGKLLIVEDNPLNREILLELLQDAGFSTDTACDGSIAVEKVRTSHPGDYSLVLMDIQMPVMDGYQATRAIRDLDDPALATIPIIAVSANAFEEDRRKALSCGMNAHTAKPVDLAKLLELIHRFLPPSPNPS